MAIVDGLLQAPDCCLSGLSVPARVRAVDHPASTAAAEDRVSGCAPGANLGGPVVTSRRTARTRSRSHSGIPARESCSLARASETWASEARIGTGLRGSHRPAERTVQRERPARWGSRAALPVHGRLADQPGLGQAPANRIQLGVLGEPHVGPGSGPRAEPLGQLPRGDPAVLAHPPDRCGESPACGVKHFRTERPPPGRSASATAAICAGVPSTAGARSMSAASRETGSGR